MKRPDSFPGRPETISCTVYHHNRGPTADCRPRTVQGKYLKDGKEFLFTAMRGECRVCSMILPMSYLSTTEGTCSKACHEMLETITMLKVSK